MELDASQPYEAQVTALIKFIDNKMHGVIASVRTVDGNHWVEFTVRVLDGTPGGLRTRWQMLKMFWKIMKGRV